MRFRSSGLTVFVLSALVTSVFFINFCGLVYDCGCRSLWAGADAHCNIHTPGVKHCPWCSIGLAGAGAVYAAILATQALFSFVPVWAWWLRLMASLLAFPGAGYVLALLIGWRMGYWN